MKKIFSFLCAALLCLSANAGISPVQLELYVMNPKS